MSLDLDRSDLVTALGVLFLIAPFQAMRNLSLRNEVAKFTSAFEYSPTPQFMKDHNGHIICINRAFTDAFGLTMDDYINTPLHIQHAYWSHINPEGITFNDVDKIVYNTDEMIFTVETLTPPKPDASILPNPYQPREYYIAKRRFPINTFLGKTRYGIIGSAMSLDLMLLYADKARTKHEEILAKSPILAAINTLSHNMTKQFEKMEHTQAALGIRLSKLSRTVLRQQEDLDNIFDRISPDLATTRKVQQAAEEDREQRAEFSDFEKD